MSTVQIAFFFFGWKRWIDSFPPEFVRAQPLQRPPPDVVPCPQLAGRENP